MMGTRAASMLTEGVSTIPTLCASTGRQLIMRRPGRGVNLMPVFGFVVAM